MSNATFTLVFPLGFLPFLIMGTIGLLKEKDIKSRWIQTQGIIVDLHYVGGRAKPVVEYVANNETLRVRSAFSASRFLNSFYIGQTVVIYYNPEKPKRFRIQHDKTPVFLWGLFAFIGVCGLCMSVVLFFALHF